MTDLTDKQKALVDTLVADGGTIKDAALTAGYSQGHGGESGRVVASKTLRLPHVQEYMRQQMMMSFGMASPKAFNRIVHLLDHANSEHVQLEASKEILNRGGFAPPKSGISLHTGEVSINIDLG
ncbi:MAG: terminase small subunit [Gammaproteobacteria bacterium]|uniref:Terminase small subunit n=1 Tax=Candidatus Thiopontia autotrophica TaxID=2841688 RepID=A0A8J6P8U9_9GAMM|nr:terminase small subunit [Candidatus Thiopontia autotrophica]